MIDRNKFFSIVRPNLFLNRLTQSQVDGSNSIIDQWEIRHISDDLRWLAYVLATPFWETARTMQPVREAYFLGEPEPAERYRKTLRYYPFYGRGLVQLTWKANYEKMGKLLGVNLMEEPDNALIPSIAADIMFKGMEGGLFTGVGLSRYFNATTDDPIGARAIINGTDHAEDIARIHETILSALA